VVSPAPAGLARSPHRTPPPARMREGLPVSSACSENDLRAHRFHSSLQDLR
jgi:hypothetical protein